MTKEEFIKNAKEIENDEYLSDQIRGLFDKIENRYASGYFTGYFTDKEYIDVEEFREEVLKVAKWSIWE